MFVNLTLDDGRDILINTDHIENIHDANPPTDAHRSTVAMLKIPGEVSARTFPVYEDLDQIDTLLSAQN